MASLHPIYPADQLQEPADIISVDSGAMPPPPRTLPRPFKSTKAPRVIRHEWLSLIGGGNAKDTNIKSRSDEGTADAA